MKPTVISSEADSSSYYSSDDELASTVPAVPTVPLTNASAGAKVTDPRVADAATTETAADFGSD